MKKLMTILAASAMFFAFGEDIDQGVDFESYTATGEGSFNPYGVDVPNGSRYWYSASAVGNVISNHVEGALAGVPIPDLYAGANSNTNFLFLETEAPLFRTVYPNGKLPDNEEQFQGYSIVENPIYLDTLVKFTAADDDNTLALEANTDKIAVAYVEREDDLETENINEALTNFVIRAGYLGSPLSQTNYYAAVPANFTEKKNGWHRLTVRSFGSIDEAGDVGFVVYLDGEPLAYDTAVEAGPNFTPKGAAAAFYTSSLHALFPSAVPANQTGGQEIAAVAFSGNGSIDDVVFTTETPKFIKDGEAVRTEITLGTGVSDVTVTVESTYEAAETNGTKFVFNLPAGTTTFGLNVTADTANGYTFDAATGITASNDVTYAGTTITITGGSPALTLVGRRDNAYYMDGETKVGFAKLSEAFTSAPAGTTIKLGYDYVVSQNETVLPTAPIYTITKNVVLDLNGKTLNGGSSDVRLLFSVAADVEFTVIDSVVGDTGSIVYGGTFGIFGGDGDIYIGSTTLTDYGPVIEGWLLGDLQTGGGFVKSIYRGKFSALENTVENDFDAAFSVDLGSDYSLVGSYWVVAPNGAVGTYSITVTPTENATYSAVYTDSGDAIEPVNNVYTVVSGKTITITATPAKGFEYASQPDGWTLSEGVITKVVDEAVAIPAPTAVLIGTYSVTVTPTANATYAAAYNDGGATVEFVSDVAAVTVGKTITITATPKSGYEYAEQPTGWTLSEGVITIEVSAEATVAIPAPTATGSYPSYIPEDATVKAKYDTWAGTYGADTGSAYETAFLLNIAPDAEDQTLKEASITISGTTVTIEANQYLNKVNGKVYIKTSATLAGLESASWTEATLDESGAITTTSDGASAFFKIKVDF